MTLNGILTIERTILIRTLSYDKQTESFEVIPLDELLGIDKLPFKMTKKVMLEIAYMGQMMSSYQQASHELERKLGYEVSTSLVRQVTLFVGNLMYEIDLRIATNTEQNIANSIEKNFKKLKGVLYIQIDGAMFNTWIKDIKGSIWKENKLALCFASPYLQKRGSKESNGFNITKKEYTAFIGSAHDFAKFVYQIAINQGYGKYEKIIILGDGATWIRKMGEEKFPSAIQILDYYHLKENIYEFAKHIFKNKKSQYTPWAKKMINHLMSDEAEKVFVELEKYNSLKLPKNVVNLNTYLVNNRDRINYKEYLSKGYFIGSGAIESANKTILQKRLKQAGMRWTVKTAQPILTLRAKVESFLWHEVIAAVENL